MFIYRFLCLYLVENRENKTNGFTIIELLVVIMLLLFLATLALPNLIGQIGKARESDAKHGVGTINRAQQVFHWQKQRFANGVDVSDASNLLGVTINSNYYNFLVIADPVLNLASVEANPIDSANDRTRMYAGQVAFQNGNYISVICRADQVGGLAVPFAGNNPPCTDGTEVK